MVIAHPDDVDFGCGVGRGVHRCRHRRVVLHRHRRRRRRLRAGNRSAGDGVPAARRANRGRRRRRRPRLALARLPGWSGQAGAPRCAAMSAGSSAPTCAHQRVMGTPSPERNYERMYANHPDHRATGAATVDAVYPDARNRWAHPELADEGLEPWTVEELWLGGEATTARRTTSTSRHRSIARSRPCSRTRVSSRIRRRPRRWCEAGPAPTENRPGFPEGRAAGGHESGEHAMTQQEPRRRAPKVAASLRRC